MYFQLFYVYESLCIAIFLLAHNNSIYIHSYLCIFDADKQNACITVNLMKLSNGTKSGNFH